MIAEGDLVICDLVPRLGAWWGDSCATIAVGEPAGRRARRHTPAPARRSTGPGRAQARRGAGDLLARRKAGLDYPHHTGHGLGTAGHEEPRIVPDGPNVLEPGMVVALEPGTYPGPWGLRVERIVVVTETAARSSAGTPWSSDRGGDRTPRA